MKERIPITEEWLKAMGFCWHQHERQPNKMWLLWVGDVERPHRMFNGPDDVGIELSCIGAKYLLEPENPPEWFCWLRSDVAGLYHVNPALGSRFLSKFAPKSASTLKIYAAVHGFSSG